MFLTVPCRNEERCLADIVQHHDGWEHTVARWLLIFLDSTCIRRALLAMAGFGLELALVDGGRNGFILILCVCLQTVIRCG